MKTRYLPPEWKHQKFGDGPWMDEPDHAEWVHRNGMPCIVTRLYVGSWAGYAGVGPSHPLYRKDHKEFDFDLGICVSDHNYGRFMADGTEVEVEADELYWFFGFDYAHGLDFIPQHHKWMRECETWRPAERVPLRSLGEGTIRRPAYADFVYIRRCAEALAEQLERPDEIPQREPYDPDE